MKSLSPPELLLDSLLNVLFTENITANGEKKKKAESFTVILVSVL